MRTLGNMGRLALIAALSIATAGAVAASERPSGASYAPGLGEFMAATQVRHAKLWFAGRARNWPLAEFELHEINEGLEHAAKLHPTLKDIPVAAMIKSNLDDPLADLAKAIAAKNRSQFTRAFDKLTAGCNACHTAAAHAFIKIRRPTVPPVPNQQFSPAR
jgi:hypothetical protein